MTAEKYIEILKPYVPEGTAPGLLQWLEDHHAKLTITRKRHTKTGDYRPPIASLAGRHFHRITVNHDLKPFSFLLTLLHEMAHLMTWTLHGSTTSTSLSTSSLTINGKKAKSHGLEWNHEFRKLMIPYFEKKVFPQPIHIAIVKHLENKFASSCSDPALIRALSRAEDPQHTTHPDGMSPLTTGRKTIFVEDIPNKGNFMFRNHIFNKVARVRKRYKCIEVNSKKKFLFSPVAEVVPV